MIIRRAERILTLGLMLLLLPLTVFANWSDPVVVTEGNKMKLGEAFQVEYYNAPSNAMIVVFPIRGNMDSPSASAPIASGKGSAMMTIPENAGTHVYCAVMCTNKSGSIRVLSDTLFLFAGKQTGLFEMTPDKDAYIKGATITVNYKNAPVCEGDIIAVYPANYNLVPFGSKDFIAPVASAAVSAADGSALFRISESGYFSLYYLHEGQYVSMFDKKDILVGSPVTLSSKKTKYIPEEDVLINYKGFSPNGSDWIGVFPFASNVATAEPLYAIDVEGSPSGSVTIPGGTLKEGSYRIVAFRQDSRTALNSPVLRVNIGSGSNSLRYSDDKEVTYYNIVSALDGLCISTQPQASVSDKQKIMKLVGLGTQSDYVQWKFVKREDGKVNVINRATGEYMLSTSTLNGNFNYSKMGIPEATTNNGFGFSYIGEDQYAISSIEEDSIIRYLANAVSGGEIYSVTKKLNNAYAWKLVPVETILTSVKGIHSIGESVKVEGNRIVVKGNQDYTVWNAEGKAVGKHSVLSPGVYMVKWADKRSVKMYVK